MVCSTQGNRTDGRAARVNCRDRCVDVARLARPELIPVPGGTNRLDCIGKRMTFPGAVQYLPSCVILYLDVPGPDPFSPDILDCEDDIERGSAAFEASQRDIEANLRRRAGCWGVGRQCFDLAIDLSEFTPHPAALLRKLCAGDIPIPRLRAPSDHLGDVTNLQHPLKEILHSWSGSAVRVLRDANPGGLGWGRGWHRRTGRRDGLCARRRRWRRCSRRQVYRRKGSRRILLAGTQEDNKGRSQYNDS